MKLNLGEVVLLRMDFHQATGAKVRPAVVLLDSGDEDFVAAPVTSRARDSAYDLEIPDWMSAGLNVPSFIRIHKLTVLPKAAIIRKLGDLNEADREDLTQLLQRAFGGRT